MNMPINYAGRPKLEKSARRDHKINTALTDEQFENLLLLKEIKGEGVSLSKFLQQVIDKVLKDNSVAIEHYKSVKQNLNW